MTKADHDHSGHGNTVGYAAIENSADYGALMILGRTLSSVPMRRVVKVWDVLDVQGDFSALRTLNASDARDKENVEDLDLGLAEVMRLRPVFFERRGRENPTRTLGILAQQVGEVLPEVVDVNPDDGKLRVACAELVPVLLRAVQELTARVTAARSGAGSRTQGVTTVIDSACAAGRDRLG